MGLALGDVVEVKIFCAISQQLSVNVRHWAATNITGAGPELADVAAQIEAALHSSYKAALSSSAQFRGVGVRRIVGGLTAEVYSQVHAGVGTATGDMMPPQTAGLISIRTTLPGRSHRGRTFIPFPTEAQNDTGGIPTAAYQTLLSNIGTALMSSVGVVTLSPAGSATMVPVMYSKKLNTYLTGPTYLVRGVWGTQRRRSLTTKNDIIFP